MTDNIKSIFFQIKHIFIQLDELHKLDRITRASIGFNNNLPQAQKTSSCND